MYIGLYIYIYMYMYISDTNPSHQCQLLHNTKFFTTLLMKIENFWEVMPRQMVNTKVTKERCVPACSWSQSTDKSVNIFLPIDTA